jgi:hypothetical protein
MTKLTIYAQYVADMLGISGVHVTPIVRENYRHRFRHDVGVTEMILRIRQRSAADGRPLDHLTDWEINRDWVGVEISARWDRFREDMQRFADEMRRIDEELKPYDWGRVGALDQSKSTTRDS